MVSSLKDLAREYSHQSEADAGSKDRLRQLYNRYVKQRESSLLDAVTATAALDALFFSDQIDTDTITPQMEEAFELVFPGLDIYERLRELDGLTPNAREATGFLNNWKGKYFEVEVRDKLNEGESVAGVQLSPGQEARLFPDPTHPGSDLQIVNPDGSIAEELQLKATSSVGYIKGALEKYPNVQIVTTEEVADKVADDLVLGSAISNTDLDRAIRTPVDDLLDTPFEEFMENILPVLPFILLASTEGAKVLIGRQSFEQAVNRSIDRGIKTGASIGVGALLTLVGAGFISLPATFATRIGIDRYRIYNGLSRRLQTDINSIRSIAGSEPQEAPP